MQIANWLGRAAETCDTGVESGTGVDYETSLAEEGRRRGARRMRADGAARRRRRADSAARGG